MTPSSASHPSDALVDFRRLKAEVSRLYPPGHPLREILMREPDLQPRDQALGKVEILVRLVFASRPPNRP